MSFPPEIWNQIFLLCLPQYSYAEPNVLEAPLLLCQVCTTWRTYAHANPKLWDTLSAVFGQKTCRSYSSCIKAWLERSGTLPLSLQITASSSSWSSIFFPHSRRWRNLRLRMGQASVNQFLTNIDAPMPLLEAVTLDLTEYDRSFSYQISKSAINLRSLTTSGIYLRSTTAFPWQNLTHLCSHTFIHVNDCLDILSQSKNLISVQIRVIPPIVSLLPQIRLPKLTTLIVRGDRALGSLLDHLVLPSLLDCELNFDVKRIAPAEAQPVIWPQSQIVSLFRRSACQITVLRLLEKDIPEEEIAAFLESMPNHLFQFHVEYDGRCLITRRIQQLLVRDGCENTLAERMRALRAKFSTLSF
jgi:hypothetical protein